MFHELYQNSPVPYTRINTSGKIVSANHAFVRYFQTIDEKLVGKKLPHLLQATDETQEQLLFTKILRGQFVSDIEVTLQDTTGTEHTALLSSFPYGHSGEQLVTLFDITKQKQVDVAKSEFVSLASHQLRTPISAMKWNLELFETDQSNLSEKQQDWLTKIKRNAEKMKVIINDFLDASQLEMGTFATEAGEIEVTAFLDNIYEEFRLRIANKQQTLDTPYPKDTVTIYTDEHLLHNIISNLVSNAVKYTPDGGTVQVFYRLSESEISFVIKDSGLGIPKSEQAQLFSKFFRASNAKATVSEGTGLGLYVVKQAVEKLGGAITLDSAEGSGTTFIVTIPRTLSA